MVIKEWKCPVHGFFESEDAVCPKGCDAGVMRVFLTPVSIGSGVTGQLDAQQDRLAARFGMTDLRAKVYEGESQKTAPAGDFAPRWSSLDQSGLSGLSRTNAQKVPGMMPSLGRTTHISPGLVDNRNIPE